MSGARAARAGVLYRLCQVAARAAMTLCYRLRVEGQEGVPREGPFLLVANHGSFLDPPIVGSTLRVRDTNFLARAGLYRGPLGALISRLKTIPLQENAGDIRAIRAVLDRLSQGEPVLIFPEGSRTYDGRLQPFREGTRLILRKAGCPVVPVAIEGAFEAWPRTRSLPRVLGCRVAVRYGPTIPAASLTDEGALRRLEAEIDRMRLELRRQMRERTRGRFPPPGPADAPLGDHG